jgi:hypothetical protein
VTKRKEQTMTESYDAYSGGVSEQARAEVLTNGKEPLVGAAQGAHTGVEEGASAGTVDVAKEQARGVAQSATGAGARVVGTVKEEAAQVGAEAGRQAKDLFDQSRHEFSTQLGDQQQRLAAGLRSMTADLGSMADSAQRPGLATDLVRQMADRVGSVAGWLEQRDVGDVLTDVKAFARQRPGMFLAMAAGAGMLAGRLTRGLAASREQSSTEPMAARPVASSVGRDGDQVAYDVADAEGVHRTSAYPPFQPSPTPSSYTPQPPVGGKGALP